MWPVDERKLVSIKANSDVLNFESQPLDIESQRPYVIMVVGVNGAGKTTTIGKLAVGFRETAKRCFWLPATRFVRQLLNSLRCGRTRERTGCERAERQDPSSVIFDACRRAQTENFDIIIADTAGRLQAKKS